MNVVRTAAEKTAMVLAARQLLSAITKVLLLADRVVVKQLLTSKDKVRAHIDIWNLSHLSPPSPLCGVVGLAEGALQRPFHLSVSGPFLPDVPGFHVPSDKLCSCLKNFMCHPSVTSLVVCGDILQSIILIY